MPGLPSGLLLSGCQNETLHLSAFRVCSTHLNCRHHHHHHSHHCHVHRMCKAMLGNFVIVLFFSKGAKHKVKCWSVGFDKKIKCSGRNVSKHSLLLICNFTNVILIWYGNWLYILCPVTQLIFLAEYLLKYWMDLKGCFPVVCWLLYFHENCLLKSAGHRNVDRGIVVVRSCLYSKEAHFIPKNKLWMQLRVILFRSFMKFIPFL